MVYDGEADRVGAGNTLEMRSDLIVLGSREGSLRGALNGL